MPGYGILPPDEGTGLLPWSWAEERLAACRNYYVATTRPDGRPHVMPVWGIWLENMFLFSTGADSRKARNFAANPSCTLTVEGAAEAVIVEGRVEQTRDPDVVKRFIAAYKEKYDWEIDARESPIYAVRPAAAFAFRELDDFMGSATRWRFQE